MTTRPATVPYAQSSSSEIVFLALLTFTIPGQPAVTPLRVVNNTLNVISRGLEYEAYPFDIILPEDEIDKLPAVKLSIDNVDRRIMAWLRGFSIAPQMLLEVITNVNFDVVERSVGFLTLTTVDYDAFKITATLNVDNVLARKYPPDTYDPVQFPGLFRI